MVDVARHLLRGLALCAGEPLTLDSVETRPWASVTFTGTIVTARLSAPLPERLCAGIAAFEFAIPGHIVADVAILDRTPSAPRIEALIIEAA